MRIYDPDEPVIFMHIPKCAGSSFISLLKRWYGPTYRKLNQDETQDLLLPRIETQDAQGNWLADVRCIHGHFNHWRGYGLPYYYPEIQQYFSIMRDPFDIVVSMYFFFKKRSQEGRFLFRGQSIAIEEHYPTVEHYVRDYPYWVYDHLPQDLDLTNVRQKLSQRFVYLGIFEDLDRSIENLATVLGKPRIPLPKVNVSEYNEPVPAHWRQRFYDDCPLLTQVYEFAASHYRI
jgi:hypothetical protein